MNTIFNKLSAFKEHVTLMGPAFASAAAYSLTKDPQFAAFTLMATGMQAPEAYAFMQMASDEGARDNAPKAEGTGNGSPVRAEGVRHNRPKAEGVGLI